VSSSLYRRWLGQFEGIFLEYTPAPPSSTLMEPPRCIWDRAAEVEARPCPGHALAWGATPHHRLWLVGLWLGLGHACGVGSSSCCGFLGFFLFFSYFGYGSYVTLQFFYSFGPIMMCFHICPTKQVNSPKLWKWLALNSYLCCFW
jgi:hypothetical protein